MGVICSCVDTDTATGLRTYLKGTLSGLLYIIHFTTQIYTLHT
jgi:hypothetical protein